MGYVVFHRDDAGTPRLEDVASLEEALGRVERARNGEQGDVRVFREVPIEVRTYYKVSVADDTTETTEPASPSVTAEPEPDDVEAEVTHLPTDVTAELAAVGNTDVPDPADLAPAPPAPRALPADPLPGAFPLGAASSVPNVEVHEAGLEADESAGRRHSLFGRG